MTLSASAAEPGAGPSEKLLYHCLLNRSFTLNTYRADRSDGVDIILERKYFVSGSTPERITIHDPEVIHNSRVLIVFQNQGKNGYFLLRAERGVQPASTEIGESTILMDNNLFEFQGTDFSTLGQMKSLPNCSSDQ